MSLVDTEWMERLMGSQFELFSTCVRKLFLCVNVRSEYNDRKLSYKDLTFDGYSNTIDPVKRPGVKCGPGSKSFCFENLRKTN